MNQVYESTEHDSKETFFMASDNGQALIYFRQARKNSIIQNLISKFTSELTPIG